MHCCLWEENHKVYKPNSLVEDALLDEVSVWNLRHRNITIIFNIYAFNPPLQSNNTFASETCKCKHLDSYVRTKKCF